MRITWSEANGYVLDRVIAAADLLNKDGIKVTVADINILYGEDNSAIISAVKLADHAFAVEDHNINGGLGSYLSRLRCECCPGFVHRIALNSYGESGPAKVLADHYGFSPEAIVEKVKKEL